MFNPYFESLKRLYDSGKITVEDVRKAVAHKVPDGSRTWITEEEFKLITGLDY